MRQTMRYVISLSAILLLVQAISIAPSQARKYTITQRQVKLSRKIDAGLRSNQLTLNEANDLRKELDGFLNKESAMKADNGGRLTYINLKTLEGKLNKLSDRLQKKELAKRVAAPSSM